MAGWTPAFGWMHIHQQDDKDPTGNRAEERRRRSHGAKRLFQCSSVYRRRRAVLKRSSTNTNHAGRVPGARVGRVALDGRRAGRRTRGPALAPCPSSPVGPGCVACRLALAAYRQVQAVSTCSSALVPKESHAPPTPVPPPPPPTPKIWH